MDVLRTAVSMLALYDPEAPDMSPEANRRKAVRLMSRTAAIVTTFDRLRKGQPAIESDPSLGFAANFLYTLTGKRPDDVMERAFDVALTLHADHELNASTFAARVTAATLSDMYSVGHQRHRGAQRPAARRRQPGCHQVAAQPGRRRRRGGAGAEHAGQEGEDSRVRPPRLPHRRSARHAPARALGGTGQAHGPRRSCTACRSAWKRR